VVPLGTYRRDDLDCACDAESEVLVERMKRVLVAERGGEGRGGEDVDRVKEEAERGRRVG